ncbi:MAG: beta-propeller fold lactonase family protein [Candidatus Hydrogenedentes bacterium]|nr:beta-propeller fold lactonase family protein [Candidatus Hydrogenedentota bacterium]
MTVLDCVEAFGMLAKKSSPDTLCDLWIRRTHRMCAVLTLILLFLSKPVWGGVPGSLSVVEVQNTGLQNTRWAGLSPDGKNLYVSDRTDRIRVYLRDIETGGLTFLQSAVAGMAGTDLIRLRVSPDGKNVYSVSLQDDALVVYSRNAESGELAFMQSHIEGVDGVTGLENVHDLAVSPGGQHLYAAGNLGQSVAAFTREATTGALTFLDAYFEGVGGISGLMAPTRVTLPASGANLYVGGQDLVVFSRNPATGALSFLETHAGSGDAIAVSPDDRHVYAGRYIYARDGLSGALTLLGEGPPTYLGDSESYVFSSDGGYLYGTSHLPGVVTVHQRNAADGSLYPVQRIQHGDDPALELEHVTAAMLSPDDRHLYVMAHVSQSVTVFSREASTKAISVLPANPSEEGERIELLAPSGFAYQWFKNGMPLSEDAPRLTGTAGPLLVLDPAIQADTAQYSVQYELVAGPSNSLPLELDVLPAGSLPAVRPLGLMLLALILNFTAPGLLRRVPRQRSVGDLPRAWNNKALPGGNIKRE